LFIAAKKCDECLGLNEIKCVSICPMDAIKKQGQGGNRFRSYGMIELAQEKFGFDNFGLNFGNPNFVKRALFNN
jgi:hypothetical protein